MLPLAQVSPFGTSYSTAQIAAQLSSAALKQRWRFERLNADLSYKDDITSFVNYGSATITYDATQAVKRTLQADVRGDLGPLPLTDLLRVWYQHLAPDGSWLSWPLGVFMQLPPQKTTSRNSGTTGAGTTRTLQAADLSQLLVNSQLLNALGIPSGASYIQQLRLVIGQYGGKVPIDTSLIPDAGRTLPATLGPWSAGTSYLSIASALLAAIGLAAPYFDALGRMRSYPLADYTKMPASFAFDATAGNSIIAARYNDRPEPTRMINQVRVNGTDAKRVPFSVTLVSSTSDNPISTANAYPMTKVINDSTIVDAATATAVALSELQAAARSYSILEFDTLPWPFGEDYEVYNVTLVTQDEGLIESNFVETKWVHRLQAGQPTTHYLERVYPV